MRSSLLQAAVEHLAHLRARAGRWLKQEADRETEASVALLVYLVGLLGLMFLLHLSFPKGEPSTGSSRSPTHQQEEKTD